MNRPRNSYRRSSAVIFLVLLVMSFGVMFLMTSTGATPVTTATISGQIFQDTNGNKVKDAGEAGLSGWSVQLMDTNNTLLDTRTTDGAGNYSFIEPAPPVGSVTVRVREVLPAGWTQTTNNPADITVSSSGGTFSGRDFCDFKLF